MWQRIYRKQENRTYSKKWWWKRSHREYVEENGYILLIINDNPEMKLDTTLEKGTRGEKYKTGAKGISPKLRKLVYGENR